MQNVNEVIGVTYTLTVDIRFEFISFMICLLSGVDIREITISRNRAFVFKFWDFAGQEEYYATHQCFLSQRSMYLLVWKVTDREKGIADLKPWLDNLETRVPNSTVIIVGTHLDQVSDEDKANGFEAEMNGKIYELLSSYKKVKKPRPPDIQILMVTCNPAVKDCKESKSLDYY